LKVHFSFDTRVSICLFSSVLCMWLPLCAYRFYFCASVLKFLHKLEFLVF
jgi:hypothetical protein